MNIYKHDIVFQEVPDHISLAFYVCGCPLKCAGCHSPELWTEKSGYPLSIELYHSLLHKYRHKADCILFLGGEWHPEQLKSFLQEAKKQNLKTALYTGLDDISEDLKSHLDFLKTGPWRQDLGGLSSPTTNQIFQDLSSKKVLNYLFQNQQQQGES